MKNKIININITTSTIIKTIIIIACIWFIFYIKNILEIFLISLLLTAALRPTIAWLENKKIPRILSVSIIYLALFSIFLLTILLIIPPISKQIAQLAENFPGYLEKITEGVGAIKNYSANHGWFESINKFSSSLENSLTNLAGNLFGTVSSIFGGVASFIFILVIVFYMTLEKKATERITSLFVPEKYRKKLLNLFAKLEEKIGLWVRGQAILMLIIGVVSFIGLLILGVNYALTLALFAGLTEIVPYLGPVIGAVPAILIAFIQSPYKAIAVIILYFIIQELENNILVPKIMQKTVGLNPLISIFALLIGAKIAGILGILLSIPITTSIIVIIKEFYPDRKKSKTKF